MMDQFMEIQQRHTNSYLKWEQDRFRQEQIALEKWRCQAKEHEKQIFGVFCNTVSQCNEAIEKLLKSKEEAQAEIKRLKAALEKATQGSPKTSEIIISDTEIE